VDGDYFAAIGTPVARGRNFGEQDGPSGQPVALVNQAAAARYWPGADPIGETLALNVGKKKTLVQIVGVVGDVRRRGLDRPPDPALYVPRPQANFADHMDLVIRPEPGVPAAPLAPAVRTRMAAVDRSFSADSVTTMEAVIDRQLARPRFSATILGIFGFLALALTVTGVYGVTAYTVRARRHEIGVRMALGADPRRLVGFVIGRGGRSIAVGLALGVLGAAAATRLLTRLLYEVKPLDLPTFVGVAGLLTAFALLASYLPARRAAKVDPMESVRCD
jgi:predicted permease